MELWSGERTTGSTVLLGFALLLLSTMTATSCVSSAESEEREPPAAPAPPPAPRPAPLEDWPPKLGSAYPDVELRDSNGEAVRLSSFRGKVLLIEPIGMNCPACIAFAGGNSDGRGGLDGQPGQNGLESIESYVERYAPGASLNDPDLVFIHMLLYNHKLRAPTEEDARRWAEHFGVSRPNHLVLYGDERFINPASYKMIPGFQLIDRDFILRSDSTGHTPTHNLWKDLLPMLAEELKAG